MADGLFPKWWEAKTPKEQFLASRDTSWAEKYGGTIPFYPQQRYFDKNLAPEVGMDAASIEALAAANQIARKSGLMSNWLADKMLPTLLVEGASGTRGWGYPDSPKYQKILEKAGLPNNYEDALKERKTLSPFDQQVWDAKMMHAMMAAKASQYGDEKAIERWNGQGTSIRGADSANHARKVFELLNLLSNPKNKPMMDAWEFYSNRWKEGAPTSMTESPETYSWADENLPAILSPAVNALSGAIKTGGQAMKNMQRDVRNWTAPASVDYKDPFGFTIK